MFKENLKKRIGKAAIGTMLLAPTVLGAVGGVIQPMTVFAETYQATQGQVQVKPDGSGQTDGIINLNGAKSTQSIKNKKFMFYKIFNVENAVHEESTNYSWNPKYKAVVQEVVFNKLSAEYKQNNKINQASDVSEYAAIDYIQSLNEHKVEGSKTEQKLNGRYSQFRYFVEDLKDAIRAKKIDGDLIEVATPSDKNSIKVTGLSWGYYVVDEVTTGDDVSNGQPNNTDVTPDGHVGASDGIHYASSLVLVNTVNNEVTITLKSDMPEIKKKIQEDDNQDAVGNKGWNDIADFQIGQTVPYQNDVTIPDMNGYEQYYFAIEDRMDPALTFHADKSKIKITLTKGDKTYKVKDNEYHLTAFGANSSAKVDEITEKANFKTDESTFGVEFTDIKAIIDREFNNKNAKNENDYSDMNFHIEYEATLNDKASENTGRPGFENDVRLIFSNNPDVSGKGERGKTPWDTVVAFTYRLNGNKVNTNNFALEGAKFRIYTDEAMKNEVIVKKKDATTTATKTTSDVNMKQGDEPGESNPTGAAGKTDNVEGTNKSKAAGTNEYIVVDEDSAKDVQGVDIVSDAEGNFSIVGLDSGTYYLKEVAAPTGYRLLKDPVKITVNATMNADRNHYIKGDGATDKALKSIDGKADLTEFYHQIFKTGSSDLKADAEAGSLEVTVVNETMEKLPVTGGQMMAIVMAAGAGVLGFSVYAVTRKTEEKDA